MSDALEYPVGTLFLHLDDIPLEGQDMVPLINALSFAANRMNRPGVVRLSASKKGFNVHWKFGGKPKTKQFCY